MRSRFAIFGHPLHPLLVTVPIGLLSWAFVADIIYVVSDVQVWYDISFWTAIAGIVTALVAALPGFGDYFTIASKSDASTMAALHMLANLTVVGLFVVAAALAADDGAVAGTRLTAMVVLHGIGVGLLAISGALGGEMVYRHHIAVIPDDASQADSERERHLQFGRQQH